MSDTPSLFSFYNLLAQASNVSCSKGANAFLSLLTTEDDLLSLAIDGFIPALQNSGLQIPQRILAAYLLDALYVSHDHPNPFHNHLLHIFESERASAVISLRIKSSFGSSSQRAVYSPQERNGTQAENEQLVWVLWKILKGESDDLAPYSPNVLSRTVIPEHLQPLHLVVHDGSGHGNGTHVNPLRSATEFPRIPFSQPKRTPTPTSVAPPRRSPGVIGSGRPSASASKNEASVGHKTVAARWSQIGIIGNGRPESSATVSDQSHTNRGTGADARREHESIIPISVLRMRSVKQESDKREPGIIGQPKPGVGYDRGREGNKQTDVQTNLLEELTALSIERRPLEPPQGANMASFKPAPRASEGNWPPNQDEGEPISIHTPSVTLQRQAIPLQPSATAFQPQPIGSSVFAADHDIKNEAVTVSPQQSSAAEHERFNQSFENLKSPFYTSWSEETSETHINEKERDELSHAIVLLLSARERVLTLTEQRMLQPHLLTLTQPLSLLRPGDISPLVAKNTDIAAKLLLLLLDRKNEDAERIERVLKDASNNSLFHMNHGSMNDAPPLPAASSIDSMAAADAIQAVVKFVSTCGMPSTSVGLEDVSPFGGREAKEGYLDALRKLPPTMQSFNLIARLLRPTYHGGVVAAQEEDSPEARVAALIRTEVLGGFVTGCVRWIERAEQEEKEGEVHDNRVAIAISSLCRFYSSLLKHGFVSAASEADTTEIMSFALQFSRFEEARSLYSTLAAART